jgi:uncharacterized protein (TIGR02145 family)
MKKFLLPLLSILLFTACQKEITTTKAREEIAGSTANKQTKLTVCHYDVVTGISKTIQVDQSALEGHLSHGDVQGDCSAVLTTICDAVWMVKNLDVTKYRNGDEIPEVTDPAVWASLTTGAWCYYENNSANGITYGKLYNWYAVMDPRGLAPVGWHVATGSEWATLSYCLEGDFVFGGSAGGKMKSVGTIDAGTGLWYVPNTDATNSSGFTGLPGGLRQYDGLFDAIGTSGFWWSSSEYAFFFVLFHDSDDLNLVNAGNGKQTGASVRCVRD